MPCANTVLSIDTYSVHKEHPKSFLNLRDLANHHRGNLMLSLGQTRKKQSNGRVTDGFLRNVTNPEYPVQRGIIQNLFGRVFQNDQLVPFAQALVAPAVEHPLLDQIRLIPILVRSRVPERGALFYLFKPEMEAALHERLHKAEQKVEACQTAAGAEAARNEASSEYQSARAAKNAYFDEYNKLNAGDFGGHNELPTDPVLIKANEKAKAIFAKCEKQARALSVAKQDLAGVQQQFAALQKQKVWMDELYEESRNLLKTVAKVFVKRYPTAAELLYGFDQFIFCLMTDALVTLHQLQKDTSIEIAPAFQSVKNAIATQMELAQLKPYLPQAVDTTQLTAEQNKSDLIKFMTEIGTSKRLQYTSEVAADRGRAVSVDTGTLDTSTTPLVSPEDSRPTAIARHDADVGVDEPLVSAPANYFPVYLAQSFIQHLAEAIHAAAPTGVSKEEKKRAKLMRKSAEWLLREDSLAGITSLKNIYDQKPRGLKGNEWVQSNRTIAEILGNAFAKTLTQAGIAFIQENPASLMRRHAFLVWLQKTVELPRDVDKESYKAHLTQVVFEIKTLRAAMKALYAAESRVFATKTSLSEISRLVAFGREHDSIATLVRVLLIASIDKLDQSDFAALSLTDKQWLLGRDISKTASDKQGYLKAVAKNMHDKDSEVSRYGIGPWVTALLEITSFQQGRYVGKLYTHAEHQAKIESTVLHLGQCVESYFEAKALKSTEKHRLVSVAHILNTNVPINDSIELIELNVDGDSEAMRLRLPSNLQSYEQAALIWSVTGGDLVSLRTLAILNSQSRDALEQWMHALAGSTSSAAAINLMMLQQTSGVAVDIFAEISTRSLAEKIKHYGALLILAETVLRRLEKNMPFNQSLAQFYKVVNESVNRLIEQIATEEFAELKDLKERANQFRNALIHKCYKPEASENIVSIRTVIYGAQIIDLRHPAFAACFSAIITADYIRARLAVEDAEGAAVPNAPDLTPKQNLHIEAAHQYFIDVMFTLAHHPRSDDPQRRIDEVALDHVKKYCGQIAHYFSVIEDKVVSEKWGALTTQFYGNGGALKALIEHYLRQDPLSESNINKALKIAIFGFSHPDFADDKVMFAGKILAAFAALLTVSRPERIDERYEDIALLKHAFAYLVETPHEILREEAEAIRDLNLFAQALGEETEDHRDTLHITLLKQREARKFLEESVAPPPAAGRAPVPSIRIPSVRIQAAYHQVVDIAMNVKGARTTNPDMLTPEDSKELDGFIIKITNLCFKLGLRYYPTSTADGEAITKENKKDNKLTSSGKGGREKLKQRCRDKIAILLKENKLNSAALKRAMNELRSEVLEGGAEGEKEFQQPCPHSIGPLAANAFGEFQSSDFLLKSFVERINAIYERVNTQLLEEPSAAERVPTFAGSGSGIVSAPAPLSGGAKTVAPATPASASGIDSEILLAAMEWFDAAEAPVVDSTEVSNNAPPLFRRLIVDLSVIKQDLLDKFMQVYRSLNDSLWFKIRVRLIRKGQSDLCLVHVMNNVKDERKGALGELGTFIKQLQQYAASKPQIAVEYQRYLKDFVWAVTETVALKKKNKQKFLERSLGEFLAVFEDCGFNFAYLIALGCEHYAMMSDELRVQKGSQLLEALVFLVLQTDLSVKEDSGYQPDALAITLSQRLEKINKSQPEYNDDIGIYYLIYTLAFVRNNESAEVYIAAADEDFVPSSKPQFAEVSPAELLGYLHDLLRSNKNFGEWHRKILKIAREDNSFVGKLVYRKKSTIFQTYTTASEHADNDSIIAEVGGQPYPWALEYRAYNPDAVSSTKLAPPTPEKRIAYASWVAYVLTMLARMDTLEDITLVTCYEKNKEGIKQQIFAFEQQALIFLAAKRFYTEVTAESYESPFESAVKLLGGKDFINLLLEKASDSFNAMLNPVNKEKYASLKWTATQQLLKREIMEWLKNTPEILKIYVERTFITGVQCKEQAELVFSLLSNKKVLESRERKESVESSSDVGTYRGVSIAGMEMTNPMFFSKTAYVQVAISDDDEEAPPQVVVSRTEDERKLLNQVFEFMYQYIDLRRLKPQLMGSDVQSRFDAFLTQVKQHNLGSDYLVYIASLEDSDLPKAMFSDCFSAESKPYLKTYMKKFLEYWSSLPDDDDKFNSAVINHICESHAEINNKKMIIIVAALLVEYRLALWVKDKETSALEGGIVEEIQAICKDVLPVFLSKAPSDDEKRSFLFYVFVKNCYQAYSEASFRCLVVKNHTVISCPAGFPVAVTEKLQTIAKGLGIHVSPRSTAVLGDRSEASSLNGSGSSHDSHGDGSDHGDDAPPPAVSGAVLSGSKVSHFSRNGGSDADIPTRTHSPSPTGSDEGL